MFLGIYLFLPGCPIVGTYLFIVASYDLLYFCVSCNLSFISDFIWVAFLMKSKSWLLRWNFCHSVSVWPTVSLSSFPVLLSLYLADYFTVQYFYCIFFCVYSITIYFVVKLIYSKSNLHLINFNIETWEAHKMWSTKILSSPPLMNTPKSQWSAEQPLMKKSRTYQKRYFTPKDKRTPMRSVGVAIHDIISRIHDIIKSHTPRWMIHKKNNYITEVLQQKRVTGPMSSSPAWESITRGMFITRLNCRSPTRG